MLLSSLSIALIACLFGFKQSRQLKQAQDLNNKQGLEIEILRSQYKHNLKTLSQYQGDIELSKIDIASLNLEIESKNSKIQALENQIKDLELDLSCSQDLQIDEDKFQEVIESHVLNVLSHIDLEQAYGLACDNNNLEIDIEDLIK